MAEACRKHKVSLRKQLCDSASRPAIPVVLAEGGQEAGLVGAADLARQP